MLSHQAKELLFLRRWKANSRGPQPHQRSLSLKKTVIFEALTETEKQQEQGKRDRKHAIARNHKVKFEAGKHDQNGRSEYDTIANPRPERDFKPSLVKFHEIPSKSRDEIIKKPYKAPPGTIKIPTRDPITEGDEPRPVSARAWGFKPSYKNHMENAKKLFLPSDIEGSSKTNRNTTARDHYNKVTINEIPKKLIKSKTAVTKNHGKDMKALLEHHFAAIN